MEDQVSYEDFAKLDIRIGTVLSAELVPETLKLTKCTVDFGELPAGGGIRTIVSGIAQWKKPEELVGRQFPYIINLAPRIIRGVESHGMLLAVGISDGVALLNPDVHVSPGSRIR